MLRVFYQNVRGLRTKTNVFFRSVLNSDYDIICISETWLLDSIFDAEIFDGRYNLYRTDRDYKGTGTTLGGGTLIAVRRNLSVDSRASRPPPVLPDADITSVNLRLGNSSTTNSLRIYSCYFPHNRHQMSSEATFCDYILNIAMDYPNDLILILGDFNISNGLWTLSSSHSGCHVLVNPQADGLTYNMSALLSLTGLGQYNHILNKNNKMLDLVISSCECEVSKAEPFVREDDHHPALRLTVRSPPPPASLPEAPRTARRYHAADYLAINESLAKIDWDSNLSVDDIETAVDNFYSVIYKVIEEHVPVKVHIPSQKHPVWYTRPLIKLINKKLKAHKKWKIYGRLQDYETFCSLRRDQKRLEVSCYNTYICNAENNICRNSRHFWSFVKSKKSCNDIPDTINLDKRTASDGQGICNLFNEFFTSVFEPSQCQINVTGNTEESNTVLISTTNITIDLVLKYLKNIDVNKGCGPDDIHPLFVKQCCEQLATPLTVLFRMSLDTGNLPARWKQSLITPIFKSGNKHNAKDYRGISKLCIIPKIFEKIIYDALFPAVRPYLIINQHGFIDKRSTESNLCEYIDIVLDAMDKGHQVDAVYTDYSKAFDKICHNTLIKKLELFGVHGDLLRWLESYLRDRTQAVAVKGYVSSFVPITSGIPQGSHLGPLLFNIFINDVIKCFNSSFPLLYADDTKIFVKITSIHDCLKLQSDLDRVSEYCVQNKLYLNVKKCCIITFSRKLNIIDYTYKISDQPLLRVFEVRDLGVLLDHKLSFVNHVNNVTARAYKMLGFIFRIGHDFNNPLTLITLYNCFVRSILEYASTVWNPQYQCHIDSIERIQNKFIKRLHYKFTEYNASCISLETRREHRDQLFLFKLLNNHIDSPYLVSRLSLRCPRFLSRSAGRLFSTPVCKRNYTENRFIIRACNKYNTTYNKLDLFNTSLNCFKRLLSKQEGNNININR
ncbi:hypothetical protein JYU34_009672 [Plutella xylostella]|uniref:Reverse transcriptase domain-containing protein n=1 Tax=Plutella xylostella TaxID=51655 RepID=A0ABQ7QK40_PLUXY|nr:hypothetical protein JYU34_009672 [Plutella xylostella]